MSQPPKDANDEMSAWRAGIDQIDNQILDLLRARLDLAMSVGAAKAGGGLAWRPAREAQLFARLAARAGAHMPPLAVERIWSTIIAQSLQAQGPAFLVLPQNAPHLHALARTFFGLLPLRMVGDESAALDLVASKVGAIAVLPAPAHNVHWWTALTQNGDHGGFGVRAALPRFENQGGAAAYAIARAPEEKSGADTAWYVIDSAAADHITQGTVIANHEGLSLLAIDGSITAQMTGDAQRVGLFSNPLSL